MFMFNLFFYFDLFRFASFFLLFIYDFMFFDNFLCEFFDVYYSFNILFMFF